MTSAERRRFMTYTENRNFMTNQKLLKVINYKFNKLSIDSYLEDHHCELAELFSALKDSFDLEQIYDLPELIYFFPFDQTILLESRFLASLDEKYSKMFKEDLINGKLVPDATSYYKCFHEMNQKSDDYKVHFLHYDALDDLCTLSHEYMHHLSSQFPTIRLSSSAYKVYSESLSVLSELKTLDFLEQNEIAQEDLEHYRHYIIRRNRNNILSFLIVQPLFDFYLSSCHLTEENIESLLCENPVYQQLDSVREALSLLADDSFSFKNALSYQHPLGMIHASSLHQDDISNKAFVHLIDTINTVELSQFERFLPKKTSSELIDATVSEFGFQKCKK